MSHLRHLQRLRASTAAGRAGKRWRSQLGFHLAYAFVTLFVDGFHQIELPAIELVVIGSMALLIPAALRNQQAAILSEGEGLGDFQRPIGNGKGQHDDIAALGVDGAAHDTPGTTPPRGQNILPREIDGLPCRISEPGGKSTALRRG